MSDAKAPRFDPEFLVWLTTTFAKYANRPAPTNTAEFRKTSNDTMQYIWAQLPAPPATQQTVYQVPSLDGKATIPVTRFSPVAPTGAAAGAGAPQPAWLYFHGGGMVAGDVAIYAPQMWRLASESGVSVFAVDYRLAPEHPAPAPVEDCYAALAWVSAHAGELGVDAARLGVMGDSAGGGLAAGAALLARDRGLAPPLARQNLIYPMIDDRTPIRLGGGDPAKADTSLGMLWGAYLAGETERAAAAAVVAGAETATGVSQYYAPARAADLSGLPPTYIDIGNLDDFKDETATFAARLLAAGVDVEFHVFSGVPHGFDAAFETAIAKRAFEGRIRAMKEL